MKNAINPAQILSPCLIGIPKYIPGAHLGTGSGGLDHCPSSRLTILCPLSYTCKKKSVERNTVY